MQLVRFSMLFKAGSTYSEFSKRVGLCLVPFSAKSSFSFCNRLLSSQQSQAQSQDTSTEESQPVLEFYETAPGTPVTATEQQDSHLNRTRHSYRYRLETRLQTRHARTPPLSLSRTRPLQTPPIFPAFADTISYSKASQGKDLITNSSSALSSAIHLGVPPPFFKSKLTVEIKSLNLPPVQEKIFIELTGCRHKNGIVSFVSRELPTQQANENRVFFLFEQCLIQSQRISKLLPSIKTDTSVESLRKLCLNSSNS